MPSADHIWVAYTTRGFMMGEPQAIVAGPTREAVQKTLEASYPGIEWDHYDETFSSIDWIGRIPSGGLFRRPIVLRVARVPVRS